MKIAILLAAGAILAAGTANAQPVRDGGKRYVVQLSGANEVPPVASGATGTAVITVNRGQRRVCWDIDVTGQTAAAAHIHIGLAGTAPSPNIVVHLSPIATGCTTTITPGGTPLSEDLLAALIQAPQVFYVNVHNATFPGGFARGQLR